MRTTATLTVLVSFVVYLASCSREENDCFEGDDGCRCYGNDTCNSGLTCIDGTCVSAIQEAEDGAADEKSDADTAANKEDSSSATAPTGGRGDSAVTASDATSGADQTDASNGTNTDGSRSDDAGMDATDENTSDDSGDLESGSSAHEDSGTGGTGGSGGTGETGGSGGSGTNQFAMYIMLDSSGSMWIPDIDLTFKWQVAVAGINTFAQDPASAGINMALQYFPITGADCSGASYDTPAVPLGRLPDSATALSESLGTMVAVGDGTPMEPALLGMTAFCREYENDPVANPTNESCVPVLITDGLPSECNTDLAYLASIAASVYSDHGITTYAIGLPGADFAWIEEMNRQGGSDCAATNSCALGYSTTLLEALEMIRDSH